MFPRKTSKITYNFGNSKKNLQNLPITLKKLKEGRYSLKPGMNIYYIIT